MDKRDIYEHLAKIYLDASQKKKKKSRKYQSVKHIGIVVGAFALGFLLFFIVVLPKRHQQLNTHYVLLLQHDAAKINFNFNPASKEIYTIDLNNLNLHRFRDLEFAVKKTNFNDTIALKIEFVNNFNERASIYVADIPHKWKNYRIPFSDFKSIADWGSMKSVSFIVEQWNTRENNGVVYIDNVGLAH